MTHEHHLAQIWPANAKSVEEAVVEATEWSDPADHDGWSPFVWIRLSNGDLILGTFPKGDTYMAQEETVDADYVAAEAKGDVLGGVQNVTVEHEDDD